MACAAEFAIDPPQSPGLAEQTLNESIHTAGRIESLGLLPRSMMSYDDDGRPGGPAGGGRGDRSWAARREGHSIKLGPAPARLGCPVGDMNRAPTLVGGRCSWRAVGAGWLRGLDRRGRDAERSRSVVAGPVGDGVDKPRAARER